MHEAGELSKALKACEMAPPPRSGGKGIALEACSGCGNIIHVGLKFDFLDAIY